MPFDGLLRSLIAPRSLRARLIVLLALLVAASVAAGFVMFALFQQSTTAQIGQAAAVAGRACDAIGRAYRVHALSWRGAAPDLADDKLRGELGAATYAALSDRPSIEGGFWQAEAGAIGYAFPTYEGSGPKTDVPQAEMSTIVATNQHAQREDRPELTRIDSGAQTLLVAACPLQGPIPRLSAWTMTRVHSLTGRTYWQLMSGLAILAVAVAGASLMAGALIVTWSRHVAGIVDVLAAQRGGEWPPFRSTGERELDHIVTALNDAGHRLQASRQETARLARQVATSERMAAVGMVTAGVAHEFRNPLAAMRLRAELGLKGDAGRKDQALELVVKQVDRLDHTIARLLAASESDPVRCERVALAPFLADCAAAHRPAAKLKRASFSIDAQAPEGWFDPGQMRRALDQLIANALQEDAPGRIALASVERDGALVLSVSDQGEGPPAAIADQLFDPLVSGRPERAGLGLAIVRGVAVGHGGQADFSREQGLTIFRIVVPCPAS